MQVALVSFDTQYWNEMLMHEKIMNKFSKSEPRHKHKQDPQNAARHKPYLKVLYNVYVVLLMDNLVDNSNVAMLFMETIKEIITLHNM